MTEQRYIVRPAIIAPSAVAIAAVVASIMMTPWTLVTIPFIFVASVSAQPNFNLADGLLAHLIFVGSGLAALFGSRMGLYILIAALACYVLSAIEKNLKMKAVDVDATTAGHTA